MELSFRHTAVTKEQAFFIYCSDIKANLSSTSELWECGEGDGRASLSFSLIAFVSSFSAFLYFHGL